MASLRPQVKPGAPGPPRITAVASAGPERGYLAQGSALRATRDSGCTWDILPPLAAEVAHLDFASPDRG